MSPRMVSALLLILSLGTASLAAGSPHSHTEAWEFTAGGRVEIHFRAGDLRTRKGADTKHLVLRYTAKWHDEDAADRVYQQVEIHGSRAEIELRAPNRVELDAELEIPSPTDLRVRMLAGDLTVEGVEGNKDVQNHFGDLILQLDPQKNYGHIDASVGIGDLDGFPGEVQGWLGKSGKVHGEGKYRLHAHVGAGDIRLSFD